MSLSGPRNRAWMLASFLGPEAYPRTSAAGTAYNLPVTNPEVAASSSATAMTVVYIMLPW